MTKPNADYVHFSNWLVPSESLEPVIVLVTWSETWSDPEMRAETFIYDNAEEAIKAISSPEWNQQFMTELDDEWEIHDDVIVQVYGWARR